MFSKILKRKTDNNSSAATTGMKRIANPKLEIKQEYVDNASNDKAAVSAETLAVSAKSKVTSAAPTSTTKQTENIGNGEQLGNGGFGISGTSTARRHFKQNDAT